MTEHKQIVTDKFLYHIDEELLVLGTERILDRFKKLSKHTASVMDYMEGIMKVLQ
jgi:hypothetical protein